jgi:head-tail adaptor
VLVATEPLTILHPGTRTTAKHDAVDDWDNATTATVAGHVQPDTSAEALEIRTRDQIVSTFRVWLPAGTTVTGRDRIVWGGRTLAVVGEPQVWPAPFGGVDHVEVLTTVSEG